jgi:hypothetical protein
MPKSVDVEDFAVKLALLAKRLNWSRAKLAQQVGVDKSLAARWLNGSKPRARPVRPRNGPGRSWSQPEDNDDAQDLARSRAPCRHDVASRPCRHPVSGHHAQWLHAQRLHAQRHHAQWLHAQWLTLNGFTLNGVRPNPVGVNVGGHAGVGLNGQVIAIEF